MGVKNIYGDAAPRPGKAVVRMSLKFWFVKSYEMSAEQPPVEPSEEEDEDEVDERSGGQCEICLKQTDAENMCQIYERDCQTYENDVVFYSHVCEWCADDWHRDNQTVACNDCCKWLEVSKEHPWGYYKDWDWPRCEDCQEDHEEEQRLKAIDEEEERLAAETTTETV
jgi:hypothetical protein